MNKKEKNKQRLCMYRCFTMNVSERKSDTQTCINNTIMFTYTHVYWRVCAIDRGIRYTHRNVFSNDSFHTIFSRFFFFFPSICVSHTHIHRHYIYILFHILFSRSLDIFFCVVQLTEKKYSFETVVYFSSQRRFNIRSTLAGFVLVALFNS